MNQVYLKFIRPTLILFSACAIFLSVPAFSQITLPDLSTVKVDNLTDAQVRQIQNQIRSSGLPDSQIPQAAAAKGMSPEEVQKLVARIGKLNTTEASSSSDQAVGRQLTNTPQTPQVGAPIASTRIYGAELFNNGNITFEPNLRIATPKNYILGPDDQLQIDITGDNEASYRLPVSAEGSIRIEFVGIVFVNGLSIEAATARIKSRITQTYPSIRSGKTNVAISLVNIRSIRITVLGEVTRPGTYTLSSLAPVFNALYTSGGPGPNGSFREIELIRSGRIIAKLDAYDFLLKGYQSNNIRLEDQDVIRIPVYKVHAELSGQVKNPKIFELLPGETFSDLLRFAGGFTDRSYTSSVKVIRNTEKAREVSDVPSSEFSKFIPRNGDVYTVDAILPRYENRVVLSGAVFRPGQFELQQGMTLSGLISKADGVKEDAYLSRVNILRLRPDNTTELLTYDLGAILSKTAADVILQREDIVTISSLFDLRDQFKVNVGGEVRKGGAFNYSEGMTLKDAIFLAGGFTDAANPKSIEIARRIKSSNPDSFEVRAAELFRVAVDENLNILGPKFDLKPFDLITVGSNAGYVIQRQVSVQGEVIHPGSFILATKEDRISDLVKRAGGLSPNAYIEGASLQRTGNSGIDKNTIDNSAANTIKQVNIQRIQNIVADSVDVAEQALAMQVSNNNIIGIDLVRILKNPGDTHDLILKEGDVLKIPELLQTVKVSGEVFYPVTTIYENNRGFKYYISQAGGLTQKARHRKAYVIYPNGKVSSTGRFLFFHNYPTVKPGAELIVPLKAERKGITTGELVAISSGLISVGGVILGILSLTR